MATLSSYITEVQRLLHDANSVFWSTSELTDYINDARERVARDTGCLRTLQITATPISSTGVPATLWEANTAVTAGQFLFSNIFIYEVTQSGTTGDTAPPYPASPPAVTITGGGGANAAGTAIVSGNAITAVIMTNVGNNYTSTPTVTIAAPPTPTGNTTATAIAVPTLDPLVSVATFSGRVWVATGRTVTYSSAVSPYDFVSVSAGSITLSDSTLHGNIQYLMSANNFLYIFGDDSINVFSDVRVTTTGSTLFTNTNVSASVGSKLKYAVFPYFRSVLFMNNYGVYALVGSTTSKLSDQLDGIFPYIDFTLPVTGGQVLLNNILCAAFNFYLNSSFTIATGSRYVQAVFFEKKWFITSQGTQTYITSVPVGGLISLYGVTGTALYKLYASSSANISSDRQSKVNIGEDAIQLVRQLAGC